MILCWRIRVERGHCFWIWSVNRWVVLRGWKKWKNYDKSSEKIREVSNGLRLIFDWRSIDLWLAFDWPLIGLWLVFYWSSIDLWLTFDWSSIDLWLIFDWPFIDFWLIFDWALIDHQKLIENFFRRFFSGHRSAFDP